MNCNKDISIPSSSPFIPALMQEVTSLLEDFVSNGNEGMIDLRGLPMSASDKRQLEELLGVGEVSATLNVAGETRIWETALSGVWWVRHKGSNDQISSEQITVTDIPEILKTHKADAKATLKQLQTALVVPSQTEQGDAIS